jgi:hypothetical protein
MTNTKIEYPWLYCASDQASMSAQRAHFRLLVAQLGVFLVISIIEGVVAPLMPCRERLFAAGSAALLAIGIVLTILVRDLKFDKAWFDCRAVAESVKTVTWRFMMNTPPFLPSMSDAEASSRFVDELKLIRTARPTVPELLGGLCPGAKEIPDSMLASRHLPLAERKELYRTGRLIDQKNWYDGKAKTCRDSAARWFWAVTGTQVLALILAIAAAYSGPFKVNLVGVLMTLVASFTAWTESKRNEDLANAYSMAAEELRDLEALASGVQDEAGFQKLVQDVEGASSREHTMWVAKRAGP